MKSSLTILLGLLLTTGGFAQDGAGGPCSDAPYLNTEGATSLLRPPLPRCSQTSSVARQTVDVSHRLSAAQLAISSAAGLGTGLAIFGGATAFASRVFFAPLPSFLKVIFLASAVAGGSTMGTVLTKKVFNKRPSGGTKYLPGPNFPPANLRSHNSGITNTLEGFGS